MRIPVQYVDERPTGAVTQEGEGAEAVVAEAVVAEAVAAEEVSGEAEPMEAASDAEQPEPARAEAPDEGKDAAGEPVVAKPVREARDQEVSAAESTDDRRAQERPREASRGQSPEDADAAQLRALLKQLSADFDNFRRRSKQQLERERTRGQDLFLEELIPVLVDLQAAMAASGEGAAEALREGVRLVLDKLYQRIESLGYKRIPTRGVRLDPRRHDALFTVPTADHEPGTVVDEISPGFLRGDRLVLPAKVSVAAR